MQIYFDTATFDKIEKEKKIKVEAQLSLIGGTMGLLTGFSIISAIEVIFFLFRSVRNNFYFFVSWWMNEMKARLQIWDSKSVLSDQFPLRLVCSLRINMTQFVSAAKQKFQHNSRNWELIKDILYKLGICNIGNIGNIWHLTFDMILAQSDGYLCRSRGL